MPTIGNEGLPGFSPGSDGVFGGGSAGLADFRFLLTFNAQQCSNLPHRSRSLTDVRLSTIFSDIMLLLAFSHISITMPADCPFCFFLPPLAMLPRGLTVIRVSAFDLLSQL